LVEGLASLGGVAAARVGAQEFLQGAPRRTALQTTPGVGLAAVQLIKADASLSSVGAVGIAVQEELIGLHSVAGFRTPPSESLFAGEALGFQLAKTNPGGGGVEALRIAGEIFLPGLLGIEVLGRTVSSRFSFCQHSHARGRRGGVRACGVKAQIALVSRDRVFCGGEPPVAGLLLLRRQRRRRLRQRRGRGAGAQDHCGDDRRHIFSRPCFESAEAILLRLLVLHWTLASHSLAINEGIVSSMNANRIKKGSV
jgi:hypothetical protein